MNGKTSEEIIEEAVGSVKPYTHPIEKQCNYTYTHPQEKQCSYSVNIVNNLESNDANSALSAAQGKALKDLITQNASINKVVIYNKTIQSVTAGYKNKYRDPIIDSSANDFELIIGYIIETSGVGYADPVAEYLADYTMLHYIDFGRDVSGNNTSMYPIGERTQTTITDKVNRVEIPFNSRYIVAPDFTHTSYFTGIGYPMSVVFTPELNQHYEIFIETLTVKITKIYINLNI